MSTLKLAVHSADHYKGNINAIITLVEYGDYECPGCRRAHQLVKRLLKERGDEVYFVFRNFPLHEFHPHAYVSSIAAEAAGKQGKFWEMHDLIFENQGRLNEAFLFSLAQQLNLDLKKFAEDSISAEVRDKIQTDFESGIRSGIKGTPAFFKNGKQFSFNGTYKSLSDALQDDSEIDLHIK